MMINIEKNKIDSGFKIPEKYFDNFDKNILSKIKQPKNKQNNKTVRKIFIYSVSIAASLFFIFTITNNNSSNNNSDLSADNYILNDNFIIEESINTTLADNFSQDEINNSDIEEYLLNDNYYDYDLFNDNY